MGWAAGACLSSCDVLGHAKLRYSVGVGLGVMRVRVSGRCFVALLARRVFKD